MEGFPIKIDSVLTAPELEALILRLQEARAEMEPPIPQTPSRETPRISSALFMVAGAKSRKKEPLGIVYIKGRAGWVGYDMKRVDCIALRDGLNVVLGDPVSVESGARN